MWNYLLCKSGILLLLGEMGLIHMRLACLMRVCVCLQIVMLKQKLKKYEEREVEVPALNPNPVQRRDEFEK